MCRVAPSNRDAWFGAGDERALRLQCQTRWRLSGEQWILIDRRSDRTDALSTRPAGMFVRPSRCVSTVPKDYATIRSGPSQRG